MFCPVNAHILNIRKGGEVRMETSVGLGALSMVPTYSMAFMTETGAPT